MKKLILLSLCIFAIVSLQSQNIIQVNNNPGAIADHTDLQTAIDEADSGDLIYLYGSGQSYGNVTITKPVSIIGPGYFLEENPETQVDKSIAQVNDIVMNFGSEHVLITGLKMERIFMDSVIHSTFQRNWIVSSIKMDHSSDILINGNYFDTENLGFNAAVDVEENNSDIKILNNVFEDGFNLGVEISSNCRVLHNVFGGTVNTKNTFFQYNIFYNPSTNTPNPAPNQGNIIHYNVFTDDPGAVPPDNLINQDPNMLFVGIPDQGNLSRDGRFELAPGSPAENINDPNGTVAGVFDGDQPYVLSGIPFIPNVFEIEAPPQGTAGSGIEVTIKVKANKM